MNTDDFETSLVTDGYVAVAKEMAAGMIVDGHSHPWDVRALVTDGEITLTVDSIARTYGVGDIFTMAAGSVHHELVGGAGVRYLAGRRDPQP